MKPKFFNIDLEIRSRTEPSELILFFKKKARVLWCGWIDRDVHRLAVEMDGARGAGITMSGYDKLLASLPSAALKQWHSARERRFDFGYGLKKIGERTEICVPQKLVVIAARWQATIGITIYPPGG